jgi:diguanylate cyclase (GGDEF)-like protein
MRDLIGSEHGGLGGFGFAAAALQLAARDPWIGWDAATRRQHLHRVVGMNRFRIRSAVHCHNLGDQCAAPVEKDKTDTRPASQIPIEEKKSFAWVKTLRDLVMTHVRTEHELRDSHRRLHLLTNIDMLTSMPSRRHLQELAEELLSSSSSEPSAPMLFDIDHFKQINERFGHAVDDAALRLAARESREARRAQDVLGPPGGDEFVARLPATAVERALRGADRITQRILAAARCWPRWATTHPSSPRAARWG